MLRFSNARSFAFQFIFLKIAKSYKPQVNFNAKKSRIFMMFIPFPFQINKANLNIVFLAF